MHLLLIFFTLFFISGCMDTPEVSSSNKETAQTQITSNIDEAQEARNEYEAIQKKRKQ